MNKKLKKDKILIIDFGSQVTKLIARRIREYKVFSEILRPKDLKKKNIFENVKGIILSGGPSTVNGNKFPSIPKDVFDLNIPILGICYGLQLIAKNFKGLDVSFAINKGSLIFQSGGSSEISASVGPFQTIITPLSY